MIDIQNKAKLFKTIKYITLVASSATLLALLAITQADIKIGGYVKTDVTYDTDQDLGASLNATAIATGDGAFSDPSFEFTPCNRALIVLRPKAI